MVSFQRDIWDAIGAKLEIGDVIRLGATCRDFYSILNEAYKDVVLVELDLARQVSPPVSFPWVQLGNFTALHAYMFQNEDKFLDWKRVGALVLNSRALISNSSSAPRRLPPDGVTVAQALQLTDSFLLENVRPGIWIADSHLSSCPECPSIWCLRMVQSLELRHIELFLHEGYTSGSWYYERVESHDYEQGGVLEGCVFNLERLNEEISEFCEEHSQRGWVSQTMRTPHAVAMRTTDDQVRKVVYETMSAGPGGDIVSIRILHIHKVLKLKKPRLELKELKDEDALL